MWTNVFVMEFHNHTNDTKLHSAVNESIAQYARSLDQQSYFPFNISHLGFSEFFENKMLLVKAIRFGIPQYLFDQIQKITPFSEDDWASYLNVSTKTLQRHSKEPNYKYKPIHTEKIFELAEVTNFGKQVFDTSDEFYKWLNTPSYALANLTPGELLKDSYGKELVMQELNNIEHGIFA